MTPFADGALELSVEGAVARLTLNRPEARNAVNLAMWTALPALLTDLARDDTVRVLVVAGAGGNFASGADIAEFPTLLRDHGSSLEYGALLEAATRALAGFDRPVIAAVEGYCLGAGLALALACDLRIASDAARLGAPPAKLGLIYSLADTQRLMHVVGPSAAKAMLFTAVVHPADEALRLGLVDEVHAVENWNDAVMERAKTIAELSPGSVRHAKAVVNMVLAGATQGHGDDPRLVRRRGDGGGLCRRAGGVPGAASPSLWRLRRPAVASAFEYEVPVLIAGGGACGAVAALAARKAGADVLLVEQDSTPRGTTSMSQGLICAAGTKAQGAANVDDDADRFFADILEKTRHQTDVRLARTIADNAGPCVDWLVEACDMPFTLDSGFRPAYGHSRARVHGWLGHGGEDVLVALHARLEAAGVDVLTAARLREIVTDATGRPVGVELERPGGERERVGCGALVLAMGGFAGNPAMVARYMPEAAVATYNGHEGAHGDAVTLGLRLGAAVADMGSYQGYGMLTDPQGISVPPGVVIEGGLMVNLDGRRFVDESADIAGVVHPVLAQRGGGAWVIFDAGIEARCAYVPETQQLMALNAAKCAESPASLAEAIGVDGAALEAALQDAHMAHREGRADGVGRTWPRDPPPSASYRALKVKGALYHTQGGLQIDGAARVLRADGRPIDALFAGGGSARGVSGPSYWGYLPAMGLCAAVTLGRIAGGSAAAAAAAASS